MNKDLRLFYLHKLFYEVYFYGAIMIPFFISKGYSVSSALLIASIYGVTTTVMEFPTGVIGDKYGHRLSILIGAALSAIGMLFLPVFDNIIWDLTILFIFATGSTLSSGSDIALVRSVSDDFKKDSRRLQYFKSIMLMLSFSVAGFIADINIKLAVVATGVSLVLSLIPLLFIGSNPDQGSTLSVKQLTASTPVQIRKINKGWSLFFFAVMGGAIVSSTKEIISSFNDVYGIEIRAVGIIVALAMACRVAGTYLEQHLRLGYSSLAVSLSGVLLSSALVLYNVWLGIGLFLISSAVGQALFFRAKFTLSKDAPDSHIASIMSFMTMGVRLTSSALILAAALFAGVNLFYAYFLFVGALTIVVYFVNRDVVR